MLHAPSDGRQGQREPAAGNTRWTFITAIFAVFIFNLDLFVVNVALPTISRDFHGASLSSLSWVLNAYTIVFAALLVVAGRLADRSGHRPWFLVGLVVFTLGSALCALAPNVPLLVTARVVQATGAAVLMPTSLALVLSTTTPARRPQMVRAWTAVGGVAAVLGPALGGVLVQYNWRWVFLINVPAGIAAILIGIRVLPDIRGDESGPLPDLVGAALLTLAVGGLALGLVRGGVWGPASARTITTIVAAAVLIVAFFIRSARHRAPIVELPLLRIPAFSGATLSALLFNAVFAAVILSAAQWCQHVWGYSALRTGLALAPGPLLMPPFAVLAGPLGKRIGNGPVAALGNLALGAGILWWIVTAGPKPSYATVLLPGLLIGGVGIGLALPTLIATAATALPANRFATGSGVLNTARQVGAVIGVAVLVAILGTSHSIGAELRAFQHGWIGLLVISCAAAVTCLTLIGRSASASAPGSGTAASTSQVTTTVGADEAAEPA